MCVVTNLQPHQSISSQRVTPEDMLVTATPAEANRAPRHNSKINQISKSINNKNNQLTLKYTNLTNNNLTINQRQHPLYPDSPPM